MGCVIGWGKKCVVSFDLSNEIFFIIPLPLENVCNGFAVNLAMLNVYVAIISNYKETMTFQISILGEIGVKESWIKLIKVKPFSWIGHPIGIGKNGIIFFKKEDGKLLSCFDLTTGTIEEIDVKGKMFWCQMVIYKENLHPIGAINN